MDNIDTYQHVNCKFTKNRIILYCKDCKVLLCNKCTKDHTDHDFDLLPKNTTIATPIESMEPSKLDIFKKRKPAQSLAELHKLIYNMIVDIEPKKDNSIGLPFKDRENQFREIEKYLIEMFNYFTDNNPERVNHYFLQCLTGSGIGKTRFVKECWNFLKERRWVNNRLAQTMKNLKYISIDFNGGGDALSYDEVNECTFEEALSKRLFTRGALGLSLIDSKLELLEEEKPLFSVKQVLDYIAQLFRDGENTLSILIHLDEFPMAHEIACEQNKFYVKEMIELLGNYRCNGSNRPESSASNIFIIPILTGTTTILQQELHLSKWLHKSINQSINLTPLSFNSCKDIINNRFKIPKLKGKSTSILENRLFGIFIRDLGVIPRYLQWLLDLELMKNIEEENIDISLFIGSLGLELINRIGSIKIIDIKFLETILYFSICRIPVDWNTTICGKTIEYWSYTGNLFLQYDEAVKGNVIFMPIFDLFKISTILKLPLLEQLTRFPLTSYTHGSKFEENTAIMIMNKINTFIKVNKTSTSKLVEFFPLNNDIKHELAYNEVKISEVKLYQHISKWLNRSNDKLEITDSQETIEFGKSKTKNNIINIFSNDTQSVNLLCSGNTSVDIRINFKLPNTTGKKYLMVVINTKFSNCDTYLGKETIDKIYENCVNLENHYKDTYILPILITNFKVNECHVEDSKGKVIIYHSKNIHLFCGKLWHRVLFDSHKSDFINSTPDLCKELQDISLQN